MSDLQNDEICSVVQRLLRSSDAHVQLTPHTSGGNNRSYKAVHKDGVYFVKVYFRDPSDDKNRGLHESMFSTFMWQHGVRCIPKPFGYDDKSGIAIFVIISKRFWN